MKRTIFLSSEECLVYGCGTFRSVSFRTLLSDIKELGLLFCEPYCQANMIDSFKSHERDTSGNIGGFWYVGIHR
jgi:hypothetical protein